MELKKTIQNYRPLILCESENRHLKPHGKSTEEFIKFMQLHKYQVYTISKLTFELLEVDEISIPVEKTKLDEYFFNFWFIPQDKTIDLKGLILGSSK